MKERIQRGLKKGHGVLAQRWERWLGTIVLGLLTAVFFGTLSYNSQGDVGALVVLFFFVTMFGITLFISLAERPKDEMR